MLQLRSAAGGHETNSAAFALSMLVIGGLHYNSGCFSQGQPLEGEFGGGGGEASVSSWLLVATATATTVTAILIAFIERGWAHAGGALGGTPEWVWCF